jgi:hypothetical protein
VKAGGQVIAVGARSAPMMVDWNNDGKKDLLVGTDPGAIRLYLNTGSNQSPQFTNYSNLKVGNNNISHWSASPEVADLNGDGKKDLLVGDYWGYIYYYENTGTDATPTFTSSEQLMAGSQPLYVEYYPRIDLNDWDEDGDLDLLVGYFQPYVNLYLNQGGGTPVFDDQPVNRVPETLFLYPNHPNPFNGETVIQYNLPRSGSVLLIIYDIQGRKIRHLVDSHQSAGSHSLNWNGRNDRGEVMPSGLYLLRLQTEQGVKTLKMILQQ